MRITLFFIALNLSQLGFSADHVNLDISSKWEKDRLRVTFKVQPNPELKLNLDAPWRLKISDSLASSFEKTVLTKREFRSEIPGYILTSHTAAKKNDALKAISYELTAYTCTKDGSQCFHDSLKGEYKPTDLENPSNKNRKR